MLTALLTVSLDAQIWPADLFILDQFLDDRFGFVDRNGKTHSFHIALDQLDRIDPDHLSPSLLTNAPPLLPGLMAGIGLDQGHGLIPQRTAGCRLRPLMITAVTEPA